MNVVAFWKKRTQRQIISVDAQNIKTYESVRRISMGHGTSKIVRNTVITSLYMYVNLTTLLLINWCTLYHPFSCLYINNSCCFTHFTPLNEINITNIYSHTYGINMYASATYIMCYFSLLPYHHTYSLIHCNHIRHEEMVLSVCVLP